MRAPSGSSGSRKQRAVKKPSVLFVLNAAIDLLESDATLALRIQTSEPVLVAVCRTHSSLADASHRTSIEVASEWCARRSSSPTEAAAAVLAPYIFGMRQLCDDPKDLVEHELEQAAAVLSALPMAPPVTSY